MTESSMTDLCQLRAALADMRAHITLAETDWSVLAAQNRELAARAEAAERKLARAVGAIQRWVPAYDAWMDGHADGVPCSLYRGGNTFGDLRVARAILSEIAGAERARDAANLAIQKIGMDLGSSDEWTDQATMIADVCERAEAAERKLARAVEALEELYALVRGECPAVLDEDRGGSERLDLEIAAFLSEIAGTPAET
jgi:hypothetical protein